MVKVSAIIPTYNYAEFLGEAIESVLNQTFRDFELIVVDDGSTDNTREIVENYQDTRIRYIYQENRGVSAAQNTGIDAAGGEYIAILGADDIWLPRNLELMVKALDSNNDIGLVCSNGYYFDNFSGATLGQVWHDDTINYHVDPQKATRQPLAELLSRRSFIVPQATMMRRSVLVEVGCFDESLKTSEDWDLFVRIVRRFPIKTIDLPLVRIRRHDINLSVSWDKMLPGELAALDKAIRCYSLSKTDKELVKKRLRGLTPQCLRYGRQALSDSRIAEGRRMLLTCIKIKPWNLRAYTYLLKSLVTTWTSGTFDTGKEPTGDQFPVNQISENTESHQSRLFGFEYSGNKVQDGRKNPQIPKVSVIIPTYNYGRYLGEAIQSVLDQTYTDFELIVVDDGSTDNTRVVVSSFRDQRIKYIYQENRGVASAQNTGIEASRGEYIALLGADDMYLPQNLELKVKLLDSHPDIGLVCSDIYHFDNLTGANLGRLWHDIPANYRFDPVKAAEQPLKHIISWGCFIWPQAAVIRRQVFTEVGNFDESFATCEDWDLFIRIVQRFPIFVIDTPLARIRRHNVSLMANEDKMYRGEVATLNKLLSSGILSRNHVKLVKRKLAPMYLRHGRQEIRGGDAVDGKKALLNCIKIKPWAFKAYILLTLSILGTKRVMTLLSLKKRLGQILARHHTRGNTQAITG